MEHAVFDSFICEKPGDCHLMCPDCYLNDSTPKLNVFPALEEMFQKSFPSTIQLEKAHNNKIDSVVDGNVFPALEETFQESFLSTIRLEKVHNNKIDRCRQNSSVKMDRMIT